MKVVMVVVIDVQKGEDKKVEKAKEELRLRSAVPVFGCCGQQAHTFRKKGRLFAWLPLPHHTSICQEEIHNILLKIARSEHPLPDPSEPFLTFGRTLEPPVLLPTPFLPFTSHTHLPQCP